jgi:hypothetical protein
MIELHYFAVHEARLAEWEQCYAPLNVRGELDKMKLWLDANPRRRKKNYQRFVVNWLNAEHAKLQRHEVERRCAASVGANEIETGGSKLVGRVRYSATDLAWYKSMGIEM